MIVNINYRFEQYSYDKKKYEYHRECCFKLLFVRPWLAVGIPPSEATDDSEKVWKCLQKKTMGGKS